jgi:DNA-binding IscR family transcriptional regulator
LAQAPDTISLLAIMRAVDPDSITFNLCLTDPAACQRSPDCVVHEEFARIQILVQSTLAAVTLASLVTQERQRFPVH